MENENIELGKEYSFAGYRWVPVHIDKEDQVAVMQSLGVTVGPWPGFSMKKFGDGNFYKRDIFGEDISEYNKDTKKLMDQIRPVAVDTVAGRGLYLASVKDVDSVWKNTLIKAATNYRSFGASFNYAWTGTCGSGAWVVDSNGGTGSSYQDSSFVVPAAFNLGLSKIKIEGDEIKEKVVLASKQSFASPVQSLIDKLRKQAEETQKLLNLAADSLESCTAESAYMQERFLDGFPVHRQGDDESDSIECPICKYEVARNDDYPDERPCHCPNCGTKLIY